MPSSQPPDMGPRIREIRKEHGLTLEELALRCGVSKSMLSQIETNSVNPTIATVWKIAVGLEIEFQALLAGKEKPFGTIHLTRRGKATVLREKGIQVTVLSPLSLVNELEMYLLELEKGALLRSWPHHPGTEEYLTILEGRVQVSSGEQQETLETGDFVIYHADVPHTIKALDGPARTHLTVRFSQRRKQL